MSFASPGRSTSTSGRIIIVRIEDLSLANAPWSLTPEMARADLLRVEIPFWPLLRGERTLRRVDVVRPALLLERSRNGAANWQFRAGKDGPQAEPRPGRSGSCACTTDGSTYAMRRSTPTCA